MLNIDCVVDEIDKNGGPYFDRIYNIISNSDEVRRHFIKGDNMRKMFEFGDSFVVVTLGFSMFHFEAKVMYSNLISFCKNNYNNTNDHCIAISLLEFLEDEVKMCF